MKAQTLFVLLVAVLFFAFGSPGYAQEQEYPNKPIEMIVASRAGGGTDLLFRLLSEELKKMWKVPVNIVNQEAAGGTTASNAVINAKKDGYTVLGSSLESLTSLTAARPKGPINLLRDFDPVFVDLGYANTFYLVRSDSKFKTLKDIVNYAKEKPGELICGTAKPGTQNYLLWMLFLRTTKLDITTLTYSGSAEVIPQLLGGHIQIAAASDIASKPYIDSGRARGIVIDNKSPVSPDVPTFAESGYPQVNLLASTTVLGPKGLPPAVIKKWEDALQIIAKDTNFMASLRKLGINFNLLIGAQKIKGYFEDQVEKFSQFTPAELGWK